MSTSLGKSACICVQIQVWGVMYLFVDFEYHHPPPLAIAEEALSAIRTVVAFRGQEKEVKKDLEDLKSARNNAFVGAHVWAQLWDV